MSEDTFSTEFPSFRFVPHYGVKKYPSGEAGLRFRGGWFLPRRDKAAMNVAAKKHDSQSKNMMALLNRLLEKEEPAPKPMASKRTKQAIPSLNSLSQYPADSQRPLRSFPGNIIPYADPEGDRVQAQSYASLMTDMLLETKTTQYHVYFADGSLRGNGRAAAGIVWRKPGSRWTGQGRHFPWKTSNSSLVELYAIDCALEIATKEILETDSEERTGKTHELLIFSDSQPVLLCINKFKLPRPPSSKKHLGRDRLLQSVRERGEALERRGVNLELHWVPGHAQVLGNVLADRLAGDMAKSNNPCPLVKAKIKKC